MAKDFSRISRIESLVQEALAKIIQLELKDKPIGMVTLTSVNVSKDLSYAKIYIVAHENDTAKRKNILHILNQSAKFLRFRLAKEIELRKVPELHFYFDEVWLQGFRVSELLNRNTIKE